MRRLFAIFVFFSIVVGSSILVHSQMRGPNEAMRYADVLAEYEPFQKLGLDAEKAWAALIPFYPLAPKDGEPLSARKINHLVEIYLHSRNLAPCGHKEEHETIGTPCSFSRGTELHNLYVRVLYSLYEKSAIDGRTLLYLLEQEPENWGLKESHFIFNGKIIKSKVDITDDMVAAKRKALVAEGFQTAVHWSNEEIRRSLLRNESGVTIEDIDKEIAAARGDAARTLINFVIRPLFLVINHKDATYAGSLDGLPEFISKNLGRSLRIEEVKKLRQKSPEIFVAAETKAKEEPMVNAAMAALPQVALTSFNKPKPVVPKVNTQVTAAPPVVAPQVEAPKVIAKVAPPKVLQTEKIVKINKIEKAPVRKPASSDGFARAYGGSRFGVTWGR